MAYEAKKGSLTLFKNDRKQKDSHPDYRGDGLQLDGTPVWVSAWLKDGKKGKFLSLSLQVKEEKQGSPKEVTTNGAPFDDEIPF